MCAGGTSTSRRTSGRTPPATPRPLFRSSSTRVACIRTRSRGSATCGSTRGRSTNASTTPRSPAYPRPKRTTAHGIAGLRVRSRKVAASLREIRRLSEVRRSRDARARIPAARPPTPITTTDHRPPTTSSPRLRRARTHAQSVTIREVRASSRPGSPSRRPSSGLAAKASTRWLASKSSSSTGRRSREQEGGEQIGILTFRSRIRKLLETGHAPMLPPPDFEPESSGLAGDPVQAASVAERLGALAKAKRPSALPEGTSGGPRG